MILRVKERGDGRSASPTVRLKGEKALGERVPWELFGGPLGAVALLRGAEAPPASFNVQEERGNVPMSATPLRARMMEGGGWFAGCLVGGRWGEGGGGEMVLGSGGREGWFLRGMVLHFVFVWFFKRLHPKKTVCLFHCLKSKL